MTEIVIGAVLAWFGARMYRLWRRDTPKRLAPGPMPDQIGYLAECEICGALGRFGKFPMCKRCRDWFDNDHGYEQDNPPWAKP